MSLELLKQYRIITSNNRINGNYKKILNNNADLQDRIQLLFPSIDDPKTQIVCLLNNVTTVPLCKFCGENPVKLNQNTFLTYCSPKCAQRDGNTRNKQKQTMIDRYGVENASCSTVLVDKRRQTCIDRYGADHHWKNEEIQNKRLNTFRQKYGYVNPQQRHIYDDSRERLDDKVWLEHQHCDEKRSLGDIANQLDVDPTTVSNYMRKHNLDVKRHQVSTPHKHIEDFLNNFNVQTVTNDRKTLQGLELDIFVPSHNLAVEYCGLYWHSDSQPRITRHYHQKKFEQCRSRGIHLITMFEDEWLNNPELCKQIILHKLGLSNRERIGARKTTVGKCRTADKQQFYTQYHIQGNGPSSIDISLQYQEKIVACMSFINNQDTYVLNRYATSGLIPGGFSKLLKHFTETYDRKQIVTFADLRWNDGDMYEKCGFVLDKELPPDYYWCKNANRWHKFNFRHRALKNKLQCYNPTLSEAQNMYNHNFTRIWDCGKKRFVLDT